MLGIRERVVKADRKEGTTGQIPAEWPALAVCVRDAGAIGVWTASGVSRQPSAAAARR